MSIVSSETAAPSRVSVGRDILAELRWTWTGRRDWLIGIGINLLIGLAYVGYNDFNLTAHDYLTTATGVAAGIMMFVLSDTVTTNQLGPEADRAISMLRSGTGVARILLLKNLALTTLLLPLALIISTGLRMLLHDDRTIVSAALLNIWIVVSWLAIGNVASILAPYRPFPLKQRWRMRSTWVWWIFVQALPYALYFSRGWTIHPVINYAVKTMGSQFPRREWVIASLYVASSLIMLLISYAVCAAYGHFAAARLERDLARQR